MHCEAQVPIMSRMLHYHSQDFQNEKQAENGLQSRSSENGSVALWIEIAYYGLSWMTFMDDCHGLSCMTFMDDFHG